MKRSIRVSDRGRKAKTLVEAPCPAAVAATDADPSSYILGRLGALSRGATAILKLWCNILYHRERYQPGASTLSSREPHVRQSQKSIAAELARDELLPRRVHRNTIFRYLDELKKAGVIALVKRPVPADRRGKRWKHGQQWIGVVNSYVLSSWAVKAMWAGISQCDWQKSLTDLYKYKSGSAVRSFSKELLHKVFIDAPFSYHGPEILENNTDPLCRDPGSTQLGEQAAAGCAGNQVGEQNSGHFHRCLAIANQLIREGWSIADAWNIAELRVCET